MTACDDLIVELGRLRDMDVGPFPHADCSRLVANKKHLSSLVPDLDHYMSEIAGYRSWGQKILTWPDEKLDAVEARLRCSFFDRYPAYGELSQISLDSLPDLKNMFDLADRTRVTLIDLFACIRAIRDRSAS